MLNYMEQLEFVGDSEPTMKTLLSNVQLMRQHLGFKTTVTHSKPGEKGRTAQVERAIQTLRRQSSTLVQMAEEKCELRLNTDHAVIAWSYIHAAWTLNRYANHSTTKMSPFELVHGRRYCGKVACFGEVVMVLRRRGAGCKQGAQWVPGVWLGKTDVEDMHVVATPDGMVNGKAIRRTSQPWRSLWLFLVHEKPFSTLKKREARFNFGAPVTPRPVNVKQLGPTDEPIDQDAADVREYARTHVGWSDSEDERRQGVVRGRDDGEDMPISKAPRLESEEADDGGQLPGATSEVVDDSNVGEPAPKAPRTSPSGSPTSRLYAPHYAGQVLRVGGEVDDERWEDEVAGYFNDEQEFFENEDSMLGYEDEGSPPILSEEELQRIDILAGFEEIERLEKMDVLAEPTEHDLQHGVLLTTRSVYDWRFRDQWKRRCRFVAREFKGSDRGNSTTFAPTSGIGSRLVLMLHVCFSWLLSFVDIKDAFLLVSQEECVLVEKPAWWKPEEHVPGQSRFWVLRRTLPGQRNAAARFFDFLADHLKELGFESIALLPSLFRHGQRNVVVCSHVDDLILAGERQDLAWLVDELSQKFTISGGELYPQGDQSPTEPVRFLKRRHFFTPQGVVISPHEKYIEELVDLYQLHGKGVKATPDVAPVAGVGKELNDQEKHRFRSGMGTLLYLSQDRLDIQHAVRHLSQWMGRPTKAAEDGLRRIIGYLKGTADYGLLLPYQVKGNSKLDEVFGKTGSGSASQKIEVFSDSDRAGDKSSEKRKRHSVSSVIICVNGRVVLSWSRSQRSIALSSCESEYLSAIGGGSEGLFVSRLWEFLVRKVPELSLVCDSSSCRAFAQRLGVGRLKHVETKFLWLQQEVKRGTMSMEAVPTLLNISDIGTKALSRARRCFLLFLIGMVCFDEAHGCYVPVGEEEFENYLKKKTISKNMREIRRALLSSLADGIDYKPKIPKSFVKAVALLALFPEVHGHAFGDAVDELMVQRISFLDFLTSFPAFLLLYGLVVFLVGVYAGYWISRDYHNLRVEKVTQWAVESLKKISKSPQTVEDWNPFTNKMETFRVLDNPSDAESEEMFFREINGELVRRFRPPKWYREKKGVHDIEPREEPPESAEEEENAEDMEVDDVSSLTRERVSLPGSPPNSSQDSDEQRPPLPIIGLNWSDIDVILQHIPVRQRERAKRAHEVGLFPPYLFIQFLQYRLMDLFPGQPDMMWDHGAWWDESDLRKYHVFRDVVVYGKFDDCWGSFIETYFQQLDLEDLS